MNTYIFVILIAALILLSIRIAKNMFNVFSVLSIPYLLIVPINNIIIANYGFYKINNQTLLMLLIGLSCFFVGFAIANKIIPLNKNSYVIQQIDFKNFKMKHVLRYVLFVELLTIVRFIYIILKNGASFITTPLYEGMLTKGALGHLLLTIYPLIPVVFFYWLKNKREWRYLAATLIGALVLFLTLVKYHVIGMLVLLYFFSIINDKRYLKKGSISIVIIVLSCFIGNYLFQFTISDTAYKVDNSYYFQHLWNYISGSLIYDNYIFTTGLRVGTDIFYKLGTFVCAPINMFLNVVDVSLFPHEAQEFRFVSQSGERGNVCDAIGYLYPSKGFVEDIFMFMMALVSIGFMITLIHNRLWKSSNKQNFIITTCVLLTFFVFFSFFGTFYVSPVPWEILFWSYFSLRFFRKRQQSFTVLNKRLIDSTNNLDKSL